ncbi:MAG: 5-formyl-3-hydroxy-2-methylpyridine 4-carboxylate 5-dehydrogenase [Geminicoccaceae bacterium]
MASPAPAIRKVAVIGLGSMGPGMMARLARGGLEVSGFDIAEAARERAAAFLPRAAAVLDALAIAPPTAGEGDPHRGSLEETVAGADLVIENVPERIETKAALYRAVEPLIDPAAILATDTSGIPITSLQAHVAHPGRFVGMHWSNPPHIIPMIEVIGGAATAPGTVAAVRDLIQGLGLLPVVVKKDVPGFVENRVLYALLRECVDLVEAGVIDAEGLDTVVRWGIGMKLAVVGPMRLLDMAGLDIYEAVSSFLNKELADRADVSPLVTAATARGRLGMKTGGGLFDYTREELERLPAERARALVAVRRVLESGGG